MASACSCSVSLPSLALSLSSIEKFTKARIRQQVLLSFRYTQPPSFSLPIHHSSVSLSTSTTLSKPRPQPSHPLFPNHHQNSPNFTTTFPLSSQPAIPVPTFPLPTIIITIIISSSAAAVVAVAVLYTGPSSVHGSGYVLHASTAAQAAMYSALKCSFVR